MTCNLISVPEVIFFMGACAFRSPSEAYAVCGISVRTAERFRDPRARSRDRVSNTALAQSVSNNRQFRLSSRQQTSCLVYDRAIRQRTQP